MHMRDATIAPQQVFSWCVEMMMTMTWVAVQDDDEEPEFSLDDFGALGENKRPTVKQQASQGLLPRPHKRPRGEDEDSAAAVTPGVATQKSKRQALERETS
jgi:hypothetical protein